MTLAAATSMKWIKAKMEELGVAHNPNYKLTFMVDDLAMITINTPKYGVIDVSGSFTLVQSHTGQRRSINVLILS